MTSGVEPPSAHDFFRLAERLEYATPESLAALADECRRTSVAPETLALRKGILDAIEIEIVGTLLRPLDTIPGYEIVGVLGKGGMGVVYEARQLNLGRTVALKTVLVSRMGSTSALSRFKQEARTVSQFHHPNIVGGYDFGEHDGRVFFAMEFVEGEELAVRIKREGTLDERLAWGIARQTAAGLAHASNHDVVHRDIKPGNLLLVEPPEGIPFPAGMPMVKIADFGLAILTTIEESGTRLTSDNTTVGSPHYMAPEQFQQSDVDLRADIYSLGATVFQMLSGKAPFDGSNLTQIMAGKISGRLSSLEEQRPGLSTGTYELINRMMAQSPEDRPRSYPELMSLMDGLYPNLPGDSAGGAAPTDAVPTVRHSSDSISEDSESTDSRTESSVWASTGDEQDAITNRRRIVLGLAVLLTVAGALWWIGRSGNNVTPVAVSGVRMQEAGAEIRLFNGLNISGWQRHGGNWIVPPGSATLEGTNGSLIRLLFKKVDDHPRPIRHFRLIAFIDRGEADAAEIQFGFAPDQRRNGRRYVLRLTEDGFSVGERQSDHTDFAALDSGKGPISMTGETAAIIERQPGGWFLSINERPLAEIPVRPDGELPEIRLTAQGGPARFSEITLTELAPAGQ